MGQKTYAAFFLTLALVLFFAVNILSNTVFRNARIDLTETSLFTLSEGTKKTLGSLQEPITLRFYYSEKAAVKFAAVRTYAERVRDMLEAFVSQSKGKIVLEVVKPEPFSPEEDTAAAAGLVGAPLQDGGKIFFGLEGSNLADGRSIIPYFSSDRETLLEYDLTMLVERLTQTQKPVLGLLSGLPLAAGAGGALAAMQAERPPYRLYQEMAGSYALLALQNNMTRVPDDVKVLVIVHPQRVTPSALYAIDQFVLKGGRALIFLDPFSELTQSAARAQPAEETLRSGLDPLLAAWGVAMPQGTVIADRKVAQQAIATSQGQDRVVPYPVWLALKSTEMNSDDPVTAEIRQLNMGSAGHFEKLAGATTNVATLVHSTDDAMLVPVEAIRYMPDPERMMEEFKPTAVMYSLAARVSGPAKTAFPGGAPPAEAKMAGVDPELPDPRISPEPPLPAQIMDTKSVNVILVADADLFQDEFWVEVKNVLGQEVSVPTANNGDFVLNAIENLSGSNNLIGLRGRRVAERKFTRVEELRRQAEQRYLSEEDTLRQKLRATEERLAQLQRRGANMGDDAGTIIITAAQRAEIERFRGEIKDTRIKLREVERNVRLDIDQLGGWLRFFNIGLVPLLVACGALAIVIVRRRRRAAVVASGANIPQQS